MELLPYVLQLNILLLHLSQFSAENELIVPPNAICACVGETLNYTCTVAVDAGSATGSTLWRGSAFMCAGNEISLIHARYADGNPESGECNDGDIVARSIRVEEMCYTSEVDVQVSAELSGKTINCSWDLRPQEDSSTIIVASACGDVRPVVNLTDISPGRLTFTWSRLESGCSTVQYLITSDCGNCPTSVSDEASATCSDVQVSETEMNCTFSVMSMTRGYNGTSSNPVTVTLKVPGAPTVNVIPVYSSTNNVLIGFYVRIEQMDTFSIYESISGSIVNYTVHFSSSADSMTNANCMESVCEYMVPVPTTECQTSGDITTISVSASNMLGQGQSSGPVYLECMNEFVMVEMDAIGSTLTCIFQSNQSTSIKMCSVDYSQCSDEQETFTFEGNSTLEFPNRVAIQTDLPSGSDCTAYSVTASDGTTTVIVEGMIAPASQSSSTNNVVAIVVPVVLLAIILPIIIVVSIITIIIHKKRRTIKKDCEEKKRDLLTLPPAEGADCSAPGPESDAAEKKSVSEDTVDNGLSESTGV